MDEGRYQKLLAVEVGMIKRRVFFGGMLAGFLLAFGVAGGAGYYLWSNRMQYVDSAVGLVAGDMAYNFFRHFPDAYVSLNRDKFIDALDAFTNAASKGQVNEADLQRIAARMMEYLSEARQNDRRLEYKEVDEILLLLQQAAENSDHNGSP